MVQKFPLSKQNFEHLGIPDLLINIWYYNEENHVNCDICRQYEKWCIEVARSKGRPEFKTFAFLISQIQIQNKKFFNFGKICSADKNCIYQVIWKRTSEYE